MFYDLLVKSGLLEEQKVPRFDGTKFSDYYFYENDKEFWILEEDFENCIPPYEKLWIEFKAPKAIVSKEKGINPWGSEKPMQWGWLISRASSSSSPEVKDTKEFNETYMLSAIMYKRYRNNRMNACKYILHVLVNKEGRIIQFPSYDRNIILTGPKSLNLSKEEKEDLIDELGTLFQPALLTIASLCNLEGNFRGYLA